ncbi:MAG TPA: SIMPL domain-containing protein [Candidatus Acidoferrales bacterium]
MVFRQSIRLLGLISASLLIALGASAQVVTVDQQHRTIELTVQSSVDSQADLASITVGYHNWGPTHDAAYQENMRVADNIWKVWISAGGPRDQISTEELTTKQVSNDDLKSYPAADRKERQFEAVQAWSITAKTNVAQKLIDLAVAAGANYVEDPSWQLSDPDTAQTQAYAAALARAHVVAEQLATSFGAKVGALLYASNQTAAVTRLWGLGLGTVETSSASLGPRTWPPLHPVKLLPPKITSNATVRVIFALE